MGLFTHHFKNQVMAKQKQSSSTMPRQIDAEREQRVAALDRVAYSYTVFWTKTARLWDATKRETVAQHLAALIGAPDFDANFYERTYTLAEVDSVHSGASLLALQKVLEAFRNE